MAVLRQETRQAIRQLFNSVVDDLGNAVKLKPKPEVDTRNTTIAVAVISGFALALIIFNSNRKKRKQ